MDLDTLIGVAAAPVLIPMLVGATKPLVRLIAPSVCDTDVDNGPWQLMAAIYGALWLIALVQSGHAPAEIDNTWTAVLAGIALGLGSTLVRTASVAVADKLPTTDEPDPEPAKPFTPAFALGSEPGALPYEAPRRSG